MIRVLYTVKWWPFNEKPTDAKVFETEEEAVVFANQIYAELLLRDIKGIEDFKPVVTKTTREKIEW